MIFPYSLTRLVPLVSGKLFRISDSRVHGYHTKPLIPKALTSTGKNQVRRKQVSIRGGWVPILKISWLRSYNR